MMTLRPVTMDDASILFEWRNDPETRRASTHTEPITWERHGEWLAGALEDSGRLLFIAENLRGQAIGTGRLELDGERAEISLTIAPEFRGYHYARPLIAALVQEALTLGARECTAVIKPWNVKSLAAFTSEGFDGDLVQLRRIYGPPK